MEPGERRGEVAASLARSGAGSPDSGPANVSRADSDHTASSRDSQDFSIHSGGAARVLKTPLPEFPNMV